MTTPNNALLVFANLTADRERRLSEYQFLHNCERWEAAMGVDVDAPSTTNWEMLKMIGIDPATDNLWAIINGLACWNVYLHNTNHLSDDDLLHHLQTKILLETVQLIPPNADMEELLAPPSASPSSLHHQLTPPPLSPAPCTTPFGTGGFLFPPTGTHHAITTHLDTTPHQHRLRPRLGHLL